MSDKRNTIVGFACLDGSFCLLENRSLQSGQGCFSNILVLQVYLCFSSFCTHRTGFSEKKPRSTSNAHNSPSMTRPTEVSGTSENVCEKPTISPNIQSSTERSYKKVQCVLNAEFTATNGLENLRKNLLPEGISEKASNLITSNSKTSSIKHYNSA